MLALLAKSFWDTTKDPIKTIVIESNSYTPNLYTLGTKVAERSFNNLRIELTKDNSWDVNSDVVTVGAEYSFDGGLTWIRDSITDRGGNNSITFLEIGFTDNQGNNIPFPVGTMLRVGMLVIQPMTTEATIIIT